MSVQINQYFGFGKVLDGKEVKAWEMRYGKDFYNELERFCGDSAFKEEIAEHDGLTLLYDGMNGESHFIGRILNKTTDHRFMDSFSFSDVRLRRKEKEYVATQLRMIIELQDFKDIKNDYHFITFCR